MSDARVETDPTCYRHADRTTGIRCQRCERPICTSCMRQASVGFQCPECTGRAAPSYSSRQVFGGASDVVVGKIIIAINVAVYVVVTATGGNPYAAQGPVFREGATVGFLVSEGEWWRLVSGAFMHSGIFHLGMNMFLLWLLSQELEPALGRVRFAIVYAVSLLGGSLGVMVLDPFSATVGASGAVFGLIGALIVLQLRAKQNPWKSGLGGLVVINLVLTFTIPGISIGGHLGGLLAGAAAGAVVQPLRWPQEGAALRNTVLVGFGFTLAAFGVVAATVFSANPLF